jgi:hypothetical protein
MGDIDRAIADFDVALVKHPKHAHSLFARGVAKVRNGDQAGGDADIAAAKAIEPRIEEEYARYGVRP